MSFWQNDVGKQVEVELSGENVYHGVLVDAGLDVIVLYNGRNFLYMPLVHIQKYQLAAPPWHVPPIDLADVPKEQPIDMQGETLSYRKVLMHVRGQFVEIYVTGDKSLHGYLTSLMNNYFVFYSPVYKTMYISLEHMKWLLPYPRNATPYSISRQLLPVNPSPLALSRTFEEQCKRLVGQLVVFDQGENQQKIGMLQQVQDNRVELITANGDICCFYLRHLKTVHVP